jgi:hypothetical protein
MNKIIRHCGFKEAIYPEKIILDAEGQYPRRLIIKNRKGEVIEYRLIKTKSGSFALNK